MNKNHNKLFGVTEHGIIKTMGIVVLMITTMLTGCNIKNVNNEETVKATLHKNVPDLPIKDVTVRQIGIDGLYEASIGHKVFYVTSNGEYLLFGNLIDLKSKKNLTMARTEELSKIKWSDLPLDLAIKEVNGTGKHQLAVFSDPDCPYCKLFEQKTVPDLQDTTIYIFLFPLPIHPNAKDDAAKILCVDAKAQTTTWQSWMRYGTALPAISKPECLATANATLDKIYQFATKTVQLEATPTIILANGQILQGSVDAKELNADMLKAESDVATAAKKTQ